MRAHIIEILSFPYYNDDNYFRELWLKKDIMGIKKVIRKGVLCAAFAAATLAGDIGLRRLISPPTPLTEEEINSLKPVFGNTIDYSKVRYSELKFSTLQKDAFMVIGSTIYAPHRGVRDLMLDQNILAHEATHIWQNQNNIGEGSIKEALKLWLENPHYADHYHFEADSTAKLHHYNIEQQGDILEEYSSAVTALKNYIEDTTLPHSIARYQLKKYKQLHEIVERDIPQSNLLKSWVSAAASRLNKAERQARQNEFVEKLAYISTDF